MEIDLSDVAFHATVWDVKRAIGGVLHGDEFFDASDPKARPMNFKVILGSGRGGMDIHHKPKPGVAEILEKTPYLDPAIEEFKSATIEKLNLGIHVKIIQFGVFYRRPGDPMTASRMFSNEYEISHKSKSAGILAFEYEHKLIRIVLGDPSTEQIQHNIAITFANIRKFAIGLDFGNPFICFELLTPPMLERQRWNRELTGVEWRDNRKFRQRLDSFDHAHAIVAPYAHNMRVILHDERDVHQFADLCVVAGLPRPRQANIEAFTCRFFSSKQLYNVRTWIKKLSWTVAFQIEALLHNGLLNTDDLLHCLLKPINNLYESYPETAGDTLRHFTEALRTKNPQESITECFNKVLPKSSEHRPLQLPKGTFQCHHVTFTPTRVLLEGPYVIQSNRVIRSYPGHQEHFIRVDFRDEDRLQYRWAREVDGTSLLTDRVGGILKNGFELGGRWFEFLAYSQSALREHAVWFLNPFHHPNEGYVTAQKIRDSLGDFSGVIKYPSKYAARIAQAFTATDPSVSIRRDQWEEMPDLALCKERPESQRHAIKPSAYQIRFLGYKGMVVIDERLRGVKMRLRKSMNKFKARNEALGEIEIARAFERPGISYLNRPLVTLLEDRGIDKKAFVSLQDRAKADIYTATDSITQTISFLKAHQLGTSYRLPILLQRLGTIGLGMARESSTGVLQDPFLDRLILYAKNHVLRDIKHAARMPIPDSYLLVGVADEGPAYVADGCQDVLTLNKQRFSNPGDPEPTYLKVQRVFAIGKPPDDKVCFFRNLKNVVVLPSCGTRSLASCLGGGDLDGDLYSIIKYSPLLLSDECNAASYLPVGTRALDHGGDSTVEDICNFIVEYINSDVLGLLSDRHLIIADQSNAEDATPRQTDYYESTRALGELFRNISIITPPPPSPATPPGLPHKQRLLSDSISLALKPYVERQLRHFNNDDNEVAEMKSLFQKLRRSCVISA
ncbi:RNA-dependent RNA polymerase 1 [Grifola frondosa]|uniref:RNA-dependent RNA polymerase n=1 Tax=Grifola frondosa TaxID=5627 RepID=A0A1C7LLZ4_GRIFR|nr:RNA-dependent RNA polymerase 1 [Grifola frondosa]